VHVGDCTRVDTAECETRAVSLSEVGPATWLQVELSSEDSRFIPLFHDWPPPAPTPSPVAVAHLMSWLDGKEIVIQASPFWHGWHCGLHDPLAVSVLATPSCSVVP